MVSRRVFKVTVLNELSIEATVCSIANILEKNTDKLIADGLFVITNLEGCGEGTQSCQLRGIIVHALIAEVPVLCLYSKVTDHSIHLVFRQFKQTAFSEFTTNGGCITLPNSIVYATFLVTAEVPKIRGSRHTTLLPNGCLVIDGKRTVFIG